MKRMRNRIISFLMAALFLFSLTNAAVPVTADAAAVSPYMYWDSDGHGWGNKGIKNGCLVVALTKMLINTGIKSTSYTPDKLYAYIKARTGFNSQNGMKGDWPKTVAGISGKLYNDNVSHSLSGLTNAQKKNIIMNYVKGGYQIVAHVNSNHWVYVYNKMSLEKGTPCMMDATNSANTSWRKKNNVTTIESRYPLKGMDFIRVFRVAGQSKTRQFVVSYHSNGGTGTMAKTTVLYGKNTKIRLNTFKKAGYTFGGWYLYRQSDGTWQYKKGSSLKWYKKGKQPSGYSLSVYGNGVSVAKTTPYYNDVVTFYAKWNKAAGTQSTQTENNSTQTTTESKPTETTPAASTLKITNAYLPTGFKLAQGKAFTIAGKITSNYAISSVTVKVETSAGVQKFAASATPNALSYDIYNLDKYMQFSKLPVGTYKITVTAKDKMASKTLVSGQFTVAANSLNVAGSGMKYPSGTLQKGATFGVYGTVSSSSNLKQVELVVRKTDGTIMFQAKAVPNAKSYNIHNLDAQMKFRTLGAGKYIYQVIATDANNTKVYLISMSFTEA